MDDFLHVLDGTVAEQREDPIDKFFRRTRRRGVGFAIFVATVLIAVLLFLFSIRL